MSDAPARTVSLRCGTLRLHVEHAEMPLDELCGYASRRSRKRGFVFVSKVLGKHYPVRPHVMAATHDRLADALGGLSGPAVFIALAETATGLGQGVYESWLRRTGRDDAIFLHTTRYRLDRPLALGFDESHSHATQHWLYEPAAADDVRLFRTARTLVLIDDEISTGRTLAELAAAYARLNPAVADVRLVCLTDWLGLAGRGRLGAKTAVHSLLRGGFAFDPEPAFDPGPCPVATGRGEVKDEYLRGNHGRTGHRGAVIYDLEALVRASGVRPGERVLVLGTGEFMHPPFLLARRLEALGCDVHVQSTTRSPLLVDGDLSSALEFVDNYHDRIPNYVYNVADRRYDRIIVGYETQPLPADHTLPARLGAVPVFFDTPA